MTIEQRKNFAAGCFPFTLLSCATAYADARTAVIEHVNYDVWTIEYVKKGRGFVDYSGQLRDCPKDSVYFLKKHTSHRYWQAKDDPWHKMFFIVDGGMVDYLLDAYGLNDLYVLYDVPQLGKYFEAMLHLGFGDPMVNQHSAVIFHQFVEECARILYEPVIVASPEVIQLKKTLDRSIESRFSLEEFGTDVNMSPAHLIRSFRKNFGCAPYEYLMRQRIDAAERLLTFSGMSVKEIAAMLCFSDQYYFSGCFKKRTGVSPSAFRNKVKS